MNFKHKSTKLTGSPNCYVLLTIQLNHSFVYTQLNDQTALFLKTQFSISHSFLLGLNVEHFNLTHREDLSDATPLRQSGPVRDGNEAVHHIFQSSKITRASPSDCLISYPQHT